MTKKKKVVSNFFHTWKPLIQIALNKTLLLTNHSLISQIYIPLGKGFRGWKEMHKPYNIHRYSRWLQPKDPPFWGRSEECWEILHAVRLAGFSFFLLGYSVLVLRGGSSYFWATRACRIRGVYRNSVFAERSVLGQFSLFFAHRTSHIDGRFHNSVLTEHATSMVDFMILCSQNMSHQCS